MAKPELRTGFSSEASWGRSTLPKPPASLLSVACPAPWAFELRRVAQHVTQWHARPSGGPPSSPVSSIAFGQQPVKGGECFEGERGKAKGLTVKNKSFLDRQAYET